MHEKQYLKSDLAHLGVSVPGIRSVVRGVLKRHPEAQRAEFVRVATALWRQNVHEFRAAAVEILVAKKAHLEPQDMVLVEKMLRESKTWALVDGLAASVAGDLVERYPQLRETLDRWAEDDDFWIRRSALLALLIPLRQGGGDFERFGRYADAMLDEKEFFIRKAIGWILRDTSRKRPDMVFDWFAPRAQRASGVTAREAVKFLNDEQKASISALRSR